MVMIFTLIVGIGLFLWQGETGIGYFAEVVGAIYTGWVFSGVSKTRKFLGVLCLFVCIVMPFIVYVYDADVGFGALIGFVVSVCVGAFVDWTKKSVQSDGGRG